MKKNHLTQHPQRSTTIKALCFAKSTIFLVSMRFFVLTLLIIFKSNNLAHANDVNRSITQTSRYKPKVFGLGLSKTGTTSLSKAVEMLGYQSIHTDRSLAPFMHNTSTDLGGYYDTVDAVWDIPTAIYYPELIHAYPDAKFVLTTRETASWYTSFKEFLNGYMFYQWGCAVPERIQRLHEFVYGSRFPSERWKTFYENHNEQVISFFAANAPNQLLVMDINEENKWQKLCRFLEESKGPCREPTRFPHQNTIQAHKKQNQTCSKDYNSEAVSSITEKKNAPFAYVSLLCDAASEEKMEYVRLLLVLSEKIRSFDEENDIVVLVYGDIHDGQKKVIENQGIKLISVQTVGKMVSNPEPWRVSDETSACYRSKLRTLELTQYERVMFLDTDLLLKDDIRQWFHKDTDGIVAFDGFDAPLNAGFFVVSPSTQAFSDIQDIAFSDSFSPENGWLQTGSFSDWGFRLEEGKLSSWSFWCAHSDQGLLFYYYAKVQQKAMIYDRRGTKDMFVHFTGSHKPFLYNTNNIANAEEKWKEPLNEWHRLWDTIHSKLEVAGVDFGTENSVTLSRELIQSNLAKPEILNSDSRQLNGDNIFTMRISDPYDEPLNPTANPTQNPTKTPTKAPTKSPTKPPTKSPTKLPTKSPTQNPTESPTQSPTKSPTKPPTKSPTKLPTKNPSPNPTKSPTKSPTSNPENPTTESPTRSQVPSASPTARTSTTKGLKVEMYGISSVDGSIYESVTGGYVTDFFNTRSTNKDVNILSVTVTVSAFDAISRPFSRNLQESGADDYVIVIYDQITEYELSRPGGTRNLQEDDAYLATDPFQTKEDRNLYTQILASEGGDFENLLGISQVFAPSLADPGISYPDAKSRSIKIRSIKSPKIKSSKAPTVKSEKTPKIKSSRRELEGFVVDSNAKT